MTEVKTRVRVIPRLELLTTTMLEFLKAFGADSDTLEAIRKGVYSRQIINSVTLHYYSGSKYQGRVTLRINWEKHKVSVTNNIGTDFRINEGKSLLEQLDQATRLIVSHVNKLRRDKKIDRIVSRFFYKPEYTRDEEKYRQAREYLGHSLKEAITEEPDKEFVNEIKYTMDVLDELEIDIEY